MEALDLIHNLLGDTPEESKEQRMKHVIQKSYDLYLLGLNARMAAVKFQCTTPVATSGGGYQDGNLRHSKERFKIYTLNN